MLNLPVLNFLKPQSGSLKNDLLSGITVALALVPEAIAFAFVAGLSPLIGLYSAFFIGLISAIVGGRPGMISGATGAMAVVIVALVALHGVEYLFPTVILCGILQVGIGISRLGKLIRMVPHSVMLGFVNGLAIVIGLAQIGSFQDTFCEQRTRISHRPKAGVHGDSGCANDGNHLAASQSHPSRTRFVGRDRNGNADLIGR